MCSRVHICSVISEKHALICIHLQVVGNLIYYRYMNPAIVAPDAFDIVSFGVDKGLTPDQVHLLFVPNLHLSSLTRPTCLIFLQ